VGRLALASFLAGAATPAAAASTQVLLSQDRPVVVSSTESSVFPAGAAVDGDQNSRWSSAFSDPQWLQVDLGSAREVRCPAVTRRSPPAESRPPGGHR